MGVRGLQSFMEKGCSNVASTVHIKDIVQTYRRETGREVVIVVDGSSCLRPLYGQLDWICGGQIKEYVEVIQNFIRSFEDIGVKLVFFFDGPTQARKRNVWIERRYKTLEDVYRAFDSIGRGRHPSQMGGDTVILPPATAYLANHAIRLSNDCEVHRSVKECDEEIADYAKQHNCFAILGQDSDYVIYDGPQYYLSILHLNVEKMTTINYNRWALARHLHLSPGLLPLLASLVGNDIVRPDDLLHFHRRICKHRNPRGRHMPNMRPNPHAIIYNVANFIRNSTDERRLFNSLPMISRKVFGHERNVSQLHLSVRSYSVSASLVQPEKHDFSKQSTDPENCWKQIQKYAEMRFKNGELDSMIYAIMHGLPFESSTSLEDFRRKDIPPSASTYRALRQRIYGLILHEKPGSHHNHFVEEWCMEGEGSLNQPTRVLIVCPESGTHPGLMKLWNEKDTSAKLLSEKWILLAHAVSPKLDPEKLKCLPPSLLAPTLLLFYLYNEYHTRFLEIWEVEAFIAMAVMLPTYTTSALANIQLARAVPRAIQLACIFGRGASLILMLLDVCGRPVPQIEVSSWHYFDGKLFQTLYQKAESKCSALELCSHQVSPLEKFQVIRSIVILSEE